MAIRLETLPVITMSSSNVPVQLSSTATRVTSVTIQADRTNSASIYLGDSSVTTSTGMEIVPGETAEVTADNVRAGSEEFLLSDLYLVSGTSGMIARAAVFRRKI